MQRVPMFYRLFVFVFLYHPSVRADTCASYPDVEVTACKSGGGASQVTGTENLPNHPIEIEACKDYTYNGAASKRYEYKGPIPFTITIKSISTTGDGITIGNFECQVGSTPEDCYKYTIKSDATPEYSFVKDNNRIICIHGQGSLTFMIDNGQCKGCQSSFTAFGEHKVKVFKVSRTRSDAQAACEAEGARLVVIKDTTMDAAITGARTEAGIGSFTTLWLGLTFLSKDLSGFTHRWDNGDLLETNLLGVPLNGEYTNWLNPGSHDSPATDENCYMLTEGVKWEKLSCTNSARYYICECA